jgi:hypothetical protein
MLANNEIIKALAGVDVATTNRFTVGHRMFIKDERIRTYLEKVFGFELKGCFIRTDDKTLVPKKGELSWGGSEMILLFPDGRVVHMMNSEWAHISLVKPKDQVRIKGQGIPKEIALRIKVMKTILEGASYAVAGKVHGFSDQQAKRQFDILRRNLLWHVGNRWNYHFESSWAVGLPACREHKAVWLELIAMYEKEFEPTR